MLPTRMKHISYTDRSSVVRNRKRRLMIYESIEASGDNSTEDLFIFTHPRGYEPIGASDVEAHALRYGHEQAVTAIKTNGAVKIIRGGPDDPDK